MCTFKITIFKEILPCFLSTKHILIRSLVRYNTILIQKLTGVSKLNENVFKLYKMCSVFAMINVFLSSLNNYVLCSILTLGNLNCFTIFVKCYSLECDFKSFDWRLLQLAKLRKSFFTITVNYNNSY